MFYLNSQIDWLDTFFFYTVPDQSVDFRVLDSLQSGRKASLWSTFTTCFAATANKFLHLPIMYIYCVYPAMLKKSKTNILLHKTTELQFETTHFKNEKYSIDCTVAKSAVMSSR
jgi:hypothetical protein